MTVNESAIEIINASRLYNMLADHRIMVKLITSYANELFDKKMDELDYYTKLIDYIHSRKAYESLYIKRNDMKMAELDCDSDEWRRLKEANEGCWLRYNHLTSILIDLGHKKHELSKERGAKSHLPKYSDFNTYRQGVKLSAYQFKYDDECREWVPKRTSKCWKDQRGKGRNKRYHQYHVNVA